MPVPIQNRPVVEIGADLLPGVKLADLSQVVLGLDLEHDGADHPHAPHSDRHGIEPVVVLDQDAPVAVMGLVGAAVGGTVCSLDPVDQTPAATMSSERAKSFSGPKVNPEPWVEVEITPATV